MATLYGIDVSSHNGQINWELVATEKQFAIVRAGWGYRTPNPYYDEYAEYNITNARLNGVEIKGIYWFSYAGTIIENTLEALQAAHFLDNLGINVPIYFDFEYDSVEYIESQGIHYTPALLRQLCDNFVATVRSEGYQAGIYFNYDFLVNHYTESYINSKRSTCKIWYAAWNVPSITFECDIWQYSDSGQVSGITGNVDLDQCESTIPPVPPTGRKLPIIYYTRIL